MDIKNFENKRWRLKDQDVVFRHKAALAVIGGGKVLDLGCGDGLFLELLKAKGINGLGIDISEEAINKCVAKGLEARVFDITSPLPFKDAEFDYVVMLDVLEHLYDPEKLLLEAARVSKRFVVVGVPNFNSLPARIQMLTGRIPENNKPNKGHIYWFNLGALKSMIARCDLELVEWKSNTFWESKILFGRLLKILNKILPQVLALSFVVKAEKRQ